MKLLTQLSCIYILFLTHIVFSITEFYFIRHGQTDFNIGQDKKYWNMSMNRTGKKQIESLKNTIKKLPVEIIFFSPLKRTEETKDMINSYLDLCAIKLPEIKEAKESLFDSLEQIRKNKKIVISRELKRFLDQASLGLDKILDSDCIPLVIGHGGVYTAICYSLDIDTKIWHIKNANLVHFYMNINDVWESKLIKIA